MASEKRSQIPFIGFIILRISVTPIVFLIPFWGFIILLILDHTDAYLFRYIQGDPLKSPLQAFFSHNPIFLGDFRYHFWDKMADMFNLAGCVAYAIVFWNNYVLFWFLIWRAIGVGIFLFFKKQWSFIIFPNVTGNLFGLQALLMAFLPTWIPNYINYYLWVVIVVVIISILIEYLLHIWLVKKQVRTILVLV
jgi:hypothetical protein